MDSKKRLVAVKREVAPIPRNEAEPAIFSARAAQSRCDGNLAHRGGFFGPVALFSVWRMRKRRLPLPMTQTLVLADRSSRRTSRVNNLSLADAYLLFGGVKTAGVNLVIWTFSSSSTKNWCERRRPQHAFPTAAQISQNA